MSKVLSAVAWPYANGPRHLGHVAGFAVPSDVFSRYMRMAGHDVLMVSGSDEHGTPILVLADKEGVTPQRARRHATTRSSPPSWPTSAAPTTSTRAPRRPTTTRSRRSSSPRSGRTATWSSRPRSGAISPSTGRTLPDRYIEGTCPICSYPEARGDQCDNCGNQLEPTDLINPRVEDQRRDAGVHRDAALLPRPPRAGRRPARVARGSRGERHLATERHQVQPQHPRRHPPARDDPRHRLGHPRAARRVARQPRQAALRLVRRRRSATCPPRSSGRAARATPSAGASGGTTPRRCPTTSWARTTSPSTPRSGRPSSSGMPVAAVVGASPVSSGCSTCRPRSCRASTSPWRASSSRRPAGYVIYIRDVLERYGPDAIRYYICAAGPENQDANFTWAEFVQRNNSELVAGWGNLVNRTAAMVAKSFGEIPQPGPLEPVDEAVARQGAGRVRRRRRPAGQAADQGRGRRGDAHRRRGEQVRHRHRAVQAQGRRPARAAGHRAAHAHPVRGRPQPRSWRRSCRTSSNAVHAAFGGEGDASCRCRCSRTCPGSTTATPTAATRSSRATTRDPPLGVAPGASSGRLWSKPTPIFTKLDESVVEEELARLRDDAPGEGVTPGDGDG